MSSQIAKRPLVIVLDNVRSAYNVGAAFRTGDAFWIEKIYLCGITPAPPHVKIDKTALGATEAVNWEHLPNTASLLKKLREDGYTILAIEQTPHAIGLEKVANLHLATPYALVFGHELLGVSQEALALADWVVEIPQYGTKKSLNVATCVGILLWELLKDHPLT